MKTYLVGGAVRDALLKREIKDRDFVVVGSSPEEMMNAGYVQVGNDFPVFIDPDKGEEYALARKETSTGAGYQDFAFDFSNAVTLGEDLFRRDFTINAMAQDSETGEIIDPFNGQSDLDARVIRHVSDHFAEDPVRILRAARFMARYHAYGFTIADETKALMRQIVKVRVNKPSAYLIAYQEKQLTHLVKMTRKISEKKGLSLDSQEDMMLSALEQNFITDDVLYSCMTQITPERVYKEVKDALSCEYPHVFFEVLDEVGALDVLFPELASLKGQTQPAEHHPEIDTFVHQMMVLQQARKITDDHDILFCALCHDFGKGLSPPVLLPSHTGHEKSGVDIVNDFCRRLKVAKSTQKLAAWMSEYHTHIHKITSLTSKKVIELFNTTGVFKDEGARLRKLVLASKADAKGRLGLEDRDYPQEQYIHELITASLSAKWTTVQLEMITPKQRSQFISEQRRNMLMRKISLLSKESALDNIDKKLKSILYDDNYRSVLTLVKYQVEYHLHNLEIDVQISRLTDEEKSRVIIMATALQSAYATFIKDGGKEGNWTGKRAAYCTVIDKFKY